MTFNEAMRKAKCGHRVREASMSKGWTIARFSSVNDFFCINPHTGSNYHFTPKPADKASTAWSVAS